MAEKVILAYSGGLDTSVAVKWIKEKYNMDVIAIAVDVGNERDFSSIQQKALQVGAIKSLVIDTKELFVNNFLFPALQAVDRPLVLFAIVGCRSARRESVRDKPDNLCAGYNNVCRRVRACIMQTQLKGHHFADGGRGEFRFLG